MMEASLGVLTCDKCERPMKRDQQVVVIAEGWVGVPKHEELIAFQGSGIRYACHLGCWDGVDEGE